MNTAITKHAWGRKVLAIVLTAVMVLGLLLTVSPVTAYAAATETAGTAAALETAFDNVDNGGTITLTSDITNYNKHIYLNNNGMYDVGIHKSFTLNLAGHKLTITNTASAGITIEDGLTLTVQGPGTLNVTGTTHGITAYDTGSKFLVSGNATVNATATGENGYGAYASRNGMVTVTGNATATGTNSHGADASYGGSVTVGGYAKGVITGAYANNGGATVTVTGDATATGNQGRGAFAEPGGTVNVQNAIGGVGGEGAYANGSGATVTVTGDATATGTSDKGVDSKGAYANNGGTVNVKNATGVIYGAYANGSGSKVAVTGNATATGTSSYGVDSIGAYANGSGATVTVTGDATAAGTRGIGVSAAGGGNASAGKDAKGVIYGAYANGNGSKVTVTGNATATGTNGYGAYANGSGSYVTVTGDAAATGTGGRGAYAYNGGTVKVKNATGVDTGAFASGNNDPTVNVTGNAKSTGANGYGAQAYMGSVTVGGNIEAVGASGCGANVWNGGKITVDGIITANTYIKVASVNKTITDYNTSTTKTGYLEYTDGTSYAWVRGASSDATLSAMTISAGTLDPAFASNVESYTVSVANSVNNITVKPTVNDTGKATVTVNGTAVASGNASGAISLNEGSNTITVVVTAEDNTQKTYTITVTKAPPPKANVSGNISFTPGSATYTGSELSSAAATIGGSGFTAGANPTWTYTYAVLGGNASLGTSSKPLTAGTYTVTAVYEDDNNYGMASGTFTVNKANQTAPGAPTLDSKTTTSVTLSGTTTALEYAYSTIGTNPSAWTDCTATTTVISGLTPNTTYYFYLRLAETANYNASPASAARTVTTDKASLGGTVTISGTVKYGETLTANTGSLTSTPTVTLGTLSYQWKRSGVNITANGTGATYTPVQADIGQTITVTVTAANTTGEVTSGATGSIAKANGPAAPASITGSYTGDGTTFTYTVQAISGAEYSEDGTTWQDSNVFTGFTTASAPTTFYARVKETNTHLVGAAADTGTVTFTKLDDRSAPTLNFSVNGDFPKTVTITPVAGAEYSFDGGLNYSTTNTYISNAGETLNLAIRLTETATHNASSVSTGTVDTANQNQNPPTSTPGGGGNTVGAPTNIVTTGTSETAGVTSSNDATDEAKAPADNASTIEPSDKENDTIADKASPLDDGAKDDNGIPWWIIIAVVVLIAALLWWIISQKRRRVS